MQTEIVAATPLLENGTLAKPGWARRPLWTYRRSDVRARKVLLKEWDYYCVLADSFGLACTIADNGYLGFVSATVFDFVKRTEVTQTVMVPFPMGRFALPSSSLAGDVAFRHEDLIITVVRGPDGRRLTVDAPDFGRRGPLHASVDLKQAPQQESMVIATPFAGHPRAFYYNEKVNCQPAAGVVSFAGTTRTFDPASCFGVLDWGRGVWTYSNTWYWASASGLVNGAPLGLNLGYGFGDTSAATENVLIVDGRVHKLDQVTFHIPQDSYLEPWTFTSNDGRLELTFAPLLDRASKTDLLLLKSDQHQVFGRFSGRVVLDDGATVPVKDLLGFAEKVINRW